ncbi:PEP/pyruvate-binding domain-containing protein [Kribbella jiaozuonensis]|uniref:PEP/pyruvate-binding domain-containing protein n=1 Tax=Kribbella jiaozuonensis TaxID=2575441 RepID=UPI001485A1DD|nr:PEP/pyruvate-binding domain-containing protein [Kribbella jiaozuonensis]
MLVPLAEATADLCGGKAGGLGALIRAGLPVPDGVVVPRGAVADELGRWLERMGDPLVAVRSSAANEDTALTSAAGQHDSFLGVRGLAAVLDAVQACRESVWSPRAVAYRNGFEPPPMAVIVQLQLDSDVSGVMFTADDAITIEASWGLGPSVVEGRVTPDRYEVADGTVTRTLADKQTTLTLSGVHQVPVPRRRSATLSDATARQLAHLGQQAAAALGAPQDLEWAIADGIPWLLQSRPITAKPRAIPATVAPATRTVAPATRTSALGTSTGAPATRTSALGTSTGAPGTLTGTPGSHGTASGPARIVHGPADFPHVRPGDILICPYTDPAWTPLLAIAAGVITEQGGLLSHAAIIARERHIPAVLAVPDATTKLPNNTGITINGTTGTISVTEGNEPGSYLAPDHSSD